MALRNIRYMGDEVLNKKCKEVKEITPKLLQLVDDMIDTMYEANGVGLAAPQVGTGKALTDFPVLIAENLAIVIIRQAIRVKPHLYDGILFRQADVDNLQGKGALCRHLARFGNHPHRHGVLSGRQVAPDIDPYTAQCLVGNADRAVLEQRIQHVRI